MKKVSKFFIMALASLFVFANTYAQDLGEATEVYNGAATALNEDKAAEALAGFQKALSMAEALGEEGAQIVSDCKGIIPKIMMKLGKDAAAAKDFDGAATNLKNAMAKATEWGDTATATNAKETLVLIYIQEGNGLLNEKKFAEAVAEYEKALAEDANNGMAHLRIGMCKEKLGDAAAAIASFEQAIANGQEANAKKQLVNVYVKVANNSLKAKDLQGAFDNAKKALEYGENPNAYKIGGTAAVSLKKWNDAVELLSKAKADANVNYNLAKSYEALGNGAKACEFYKLIATDAKLGEFAKSKVTALCK